jgi:hypothetical protein
LEAAVAGIFMLGILGGGAGQPVSEPELEVERDEVERVV